MTEIEIAPDGRIFLFGASREVLELLEKSGLSDAAMRERLHDKVSGEVRRSRPPVFNSPDYTSAAVEK